MSDRSRDCLTEVGVLCDDGLVHRACGAGSAETLCRDVERSAGRVPWHDPDFGCVVNACRDPRERNCGFKITRVADERVNCARRAAG